MKDKNEKTAPSSGRRSFMKKFSAGTVGSAVLLNLPPGVSAGEVDEEALAAHAGKRLLRMTVNGSKVKILVEPRETLARVLRDRLGLTGTKMTCERGQCGTCTVVLNGKAVYSCHMLALDAEDGEVITVEGLLKHGQLHPLQEAFIDHDGLQCGFCTPGQIMAAHALLLKNPKPTREQILDGMSGNLCRCSAYPNIVDSVLGAAETTG